MYTRNSQYERSIILKRQIFNCGIRLLSGIHHGWSDEENFVPDYDEEVEVSSPSEGIVDAKEKPGEEREKRSRSHQKMPLERRENKRPVTPVRHCNLLKSKVVVPKSRKDPAEWI